MLVYSQYWKTSEAQDFVNKIFREIDLSKRGKITYSGITYACGNKPNHSLIHKEFLISAKHPNEILTEEHLEAVFNVIDTVRSQELAVC